MERNRIFLMLAALATMHAPLRAQLATDCAKNVSVASSVPLSTLVSKAKALRLRKDEYESTSAFEARATKAGAAAFGQPLTVLWAQPRLTKFDADRGVVMVERYTVNTTCAMYRFDLPVEFANIHTGPEGKYDWQKQDRPYCLTKAAGRADGGSYVASNAYGATASVKSIKDTEQGIYLGTGLVGLDFFPKQDPTSDAKDPWLEAPATAGEARSLATNAALIITVTPRAPYYATGHYYAGATISSPTSVTTNMDMIIGLPTCVALVDRVSGKVFARREFAFGPRN